ncbi:hypothetical protein Stsp02_01400 [Streptomyces sp. NBRC 14336]|nr:hypothetical protein Stsp02_01400 [Streptomyces sp. NBRC 14336]
MGAPNGWRPWGSGCNTPRVLQHYIQVGQVGHWRISLSHLFVQVSALTGQSDTWDTPYGALRRQWATVGSWK